MHTGRSSQLAILELRLAFHGWDSCAKQVLLVNRVVVLHKVSQVQMLLSERRPNGRSSRTRRAIPSVRFTIVIRKLVLMQTLSILDSAVRYRAAHVMPMRNT